MGGQIGRLVITHKDRLCASPPVGVQGGDAWRTNRGSGSLLCEQQDVFGLRVHNRSPAPIGSALDLSGMWREA